MGFESKKNDSKLDTVYTTPGPDSEEISTSMFMSPDSNYQFTDLAMQPQKDCYKSLPIYRIASEMPPPDVPQSASALTEKLNHDQRTHMISQKLFDKYKLKITKSQRQHNDRNRYFKLLTTRPETREENSFTALFKKPPSYGFAIDEAFLDDSLDIVVVGKIDYDRGLAKMRSKMKSQSMNKPAERITLPKIKVQVKSQAQFNSDLKEAISQPLSRLDHDSADHYRLLVELAKSSQLERQFNRLIAHRKQQVQQILEYSESWAALLKKIEH